MTHFDNSDSVWNERENVLFEVNSSFPDVSEQLSFHVSKHLSVSKAQQTRVKTHVF